MKFNDMKDSVGELTSDPQGARMKVRKQQRECKVGM